MMRINGGYLQDILLVMEHASERGLIKAGCWALSNFCNAFKFPYHDTANAAIPVLCKHLAAGTVTDLATAAISCEVIALRTYRPERTIVVLEFGLIRFLIEQLSPCQQVLRPKWAHKIQCSNSELYDKFQESALQVLANAALLRKGV
jgi:hypothetical protein